MFEKKAEERCDKVVCGSCALYCSSKCHDWQDEYDVWKDGAEFGYNKANEETKTIIQDLLNNSDEYARQRAIEYLGEASEEQPKYCHDCAKFDEMPKGPRCKTCDDGSRFLKKV